ncbi:4-hydroxythreonine-4-phosphate dehydrogenase PdxA [Geothermobacter ehrlichii]|nr:4-hydroxythreonine-4-phosphate dehydrogenase PdxA [Geothermobacter ehrlichii]
MKPLILTMGDPTGIGPELILKALLAGELDPFADRLLVAGDAGVLARASAPFAVAARFEPEDDGTGRLWLADRSLPVRVLSRLDAGRLVPGCPDAACGAAMAAYVEWAVAACRRGEAAGMVTCPISKAAMQAAGIPFPGHTELLAERCGVEKVVMMLAGARLKVCLVTTHLAYREVPARLSREEILATLRIVDRSLRRQFGLERPRLAVAALNPHAGEDGLFGDEEKRIIVPALEEARAAGIDARGPFPPDTLFYFAARGDCDAVICMYHDQGLIPLKLLHFEDAVNVTLGLPIVRTSVDHGTAYDLVGTGKANTASLLAAIRMAEQMTRNS